MSLDAYSPCPGGKGKKIKFCCQDMLNDLQKIERMLEGEQYLACLKHIETLETKRPGEACLSATKALLLRIMDRFDDAKSTVDEFLAKHPDNPLALAESAILLATEGNSREAVKAVTSAIAASGSQMHPRVYGSMSLVSRVLIRDGQILAARAIALIQVGIKQDDSNPIELLGQTNLSPAIPLVVKDGLRLQSCPPDAPWKASFDEAVELANQARWIEAGERFEKLAEQADDSPAVWGNLAAVRGWQADPDGCVGALHKLASLDIPLEDAVEAESLALLLSDDPLGDRLDVLHATFPVVDAQRVEAALGASPRTSTSPVDRSALVEDGEPPPKAVFFLLDREPPGPGAQITPDTFPKILCMALLFGKQTDREACLEVVDLVSPNFEPVKLLLTELLGDDLGSDVTEEVVGHVSASQELLTQHWSLPARQSQEALQELIHGYVEQALLEKWPQAPVGLLDGKSPQEAADDEAYRVKLLAAIMVLEFWLQQSRYPFDCNRLRGRLGLPAPEPVDPEKNEIVAVPLARLARVMVDKLSDEALVAGFRRALGFAVREALPKFARAVVERPSLANREERHQAYGILARVSEDPDQALYYVNEGRRAAEAAGQSSASWDITELSLRFQRGEPQEASRLLNHIQNDHIREPGIAQAVTELLVEIGVLNPDGTPAMQAGPPPGEGPATTDQPEKSGIWTPGGQESGGEKPKLWTPGMD